MGNALNAFAANGSDVETTGGDTISVDLVNFAQTANGANDEVAYNSAMEVLVELASTVIRIGRAPT